MNPLLWRVPDDHPAFAGHFPGTPILPGVVLLDVALRTIADAHQLALDRCEIGSAKFLRPVRGGDTLAFHHQRLAGGAIQFEVRLSDTLVASGTLSPCAPDESA